MVEENLSSSTERQALDVVRTVFESAGWDIKDAQWSPHKSHYAEDLVLTDAHGKAYHVVLKSFKEARSDHLKAVFAQALLEARSRAKKDHTRPGVLMWVSNLSPWMVDRIVDFHKENAEGEPFAVLSTKGVHYALFPGLDYKPIDTSIKPRIHHYRRDHALPPRLVFSDLAQWMLKLLLAADIKRENLISATASRYSSAAELARAADCSRMTASRLVSALNAEGFIESESFLNLVRRKRLAERWKAEYQAPAPARPMKFLSPAPADEQLRKLLKKEDAILGLFAAAHALGIGHVRGVPPTVWVPSLEAAEDWRLVRYAKSGERPDLIVQQHRFPQSLANGAVTRDGIRVSDAIQTWLDVSAHPARGAEQAAELEHGVLAKVTGEKA